MKILWGCRNGNIPHLATSIYILSKIKRAPHYRIPHNKAYVKDVQNITLPDLWWLIFTLRHSLTPVRKTHGGFGAVLSMAGIHLRTCRNMRTYYMCECLHLYLSVSCAFHFTLWIPMELGLFIHWRRFLSPSLSLSLWLPRGARSTDLLKPSTYGHLQPVSLICHFHHRAVHLDSLYTLLHIHT